MLVQRIPHHQASYTQPNSIWMTHSGNDRLLMGSPLRRRGISKAITAALLVILVFATLVQLVVFIGMSQASSACSCGRSPFQSCSLWCPLQYFASLIDASVRLLGYSLLLIATALALPFNTAFFKLIDEWLTHHPMLPVILGPEAPMMLVAPISAPIAEELAKALGVLLFFG